MVKREAMVMKLLGHVGNAAARVDHWVYEYLYFGAANPIGWDTDSILIWKWIWYDDDNDDNDNDDECIDIQRGTRIHKIPLAILNDVICSKMLHEIIESHIQYQRLSTRLQ